MSRWLRLALGWHSWIREKNKKQRNKTGASLHDFVVFTIIRNFHASIVSSAELPQSQEFKRSIIATFEERCVYSSFLRVLSQSLVRFIKTHKKIVLCWRRKRKATKRQEKTLFCEYLQNKQIDVAKVFEINEGDIEFGRRV